MELKAAAFDAAAFFDARSDGPKLGGMKIGLSVALEVGAGGSRWYSCQAEDPVYLSEMQFAEEVRRRRSYYRYASSKKSRISSMLLVRPRAHMSLIRAFGPPSRPQRIMPLSSRSAPPPR